jgi:hypothetical protein
MLKKIEVVNWEKEQNKEEGYVYIEELKMQVEREKAKLPLKVKDGLRRELLRIKALSRVKEYERTVKLLHREFEKIRLADELMIYQNKLYQFQPVKEELVRRAFTISKIAKLYADEVSLSSKRKPVGKPKTKAVVVDTRNKNVEIN